MIPYFGNLNKTVLEAKNAPPERVLGGGWGVLASLRLFGLRLACIRSHHASGPLINSWGIANEGNTGIKGSEEDKDAEKKEIEIK